MTLIKKVSLLHLVDFYININISKFLITLKTLKFEKEEEWKKMKKKKLKEEKSIITISNFNFVALYINK